MEAFSVKGTVFSGKNEGVKFIKLSWVREQIMEKLGFAPYLGTLNIKLTKNDSAKLKRTLKKAKSIEISPAEGFCRGRCFKAHLGNIKCAIVIPEIAEYPEDVLEIIAPANLRKKLQLEDGDKVEVKIFLE